MPFLCTILQVLDRSPLSAVKSSGSPEYAPPTQRWQSPPTRRWRVRCLKFAVPRPTFWRPDSSAVFSHMPSFRYGQLTESVTTDEAGGEARTLVVFSRNHESSCSARRQNPSDLAPSCEGCRASMRLRILLWRLHLLGFAVTPTHSILAIPGRRCRFPP